MARLNIFTYSRRIFISAAVAGATLFLAGLFLYQAHAQALPLEYKTNAGGASTSTVYLSDAGRAAAAAPPANKAPMLEMHIANNGLVLLRGARVVSISGDNIRVKMAFRGADFSWVLRTNYNTRFITRAGEKGTLGDVQAGDVVTVSGMLAAGGAEPTVSAQYVRE